MTRTAIDTNVLSAILKAEPNSLPLIDLLERARGSGPLLISPVVYSELLGTPPHTPVFIEEFLHDTGITLEEAFPLAVWEAAGVAFQAYAVRRKASGGGVPRRILADFLIGAHAQEKADRLATLDPQHYRLAFPALTLLTL
ncbi:type II toxin-antitoxin system VapC family toxin [Deinococcus sp. YIM 134068]|uniref:type II toxin-antitoxin system VapC family toxin n=1 Tax=Deinococcus lichenicola TaxID=3118910 RepID=UPI002F93DC22